MSRAMQIIGIILLGIFTLVIINLMNDVRSTNELDYYLLQETVEASMYDAVDYSFYRETGLLKVDRDMFLESFNRRFAESVDANQFREYKIKVLDFNETPPKVSVEVTTTTAAAVKGEGVDVVNRVDGIIETIYDDYVYSRGYSEFAPAQQKEKEPTNVVPPEVKTTYPAVEATTTYAASVSISTASIGHSRENCGHCYINGHYEGYLYCEQEGYAVDTSCGCASGWSEVGGHCEKKSYSCKNGDKLSGTTCTHKGYSCPNGGTLSGTTCVVQ